MPVEAFGVLLRANSAKGRSLSQLSCWYKQKDLNVLLNSLVHTFGLAIGRRVIVGRIMHFHAEEFGKGPEES
jgi:hypothetical protein